MPQFLDNLRGRKLISIDGYLCESCTQVSDSAGQLLSEMRPGQKGVITSVCDHIDPAKSRRLFDLGFAPGEEIAVLRRSLTGDPRIYAVSGYEIALRSSQSRCVKVQVEA